MVRDLRDELYHKFHCLSDGFGKDLLTPFEEQARYVASSLESSEEIVAQISNNLIQSASNQIEDALQSVDLEKFTEQLSVDLANIVEHCKQSFLRQIRGLCEKSKFCNEIINHITDYEIEKYVQKNFIQRTNKLYESSEKYIPHALVDLIKELATDRKDFPQHRHQQISEFGRTAVKHAARFLKMSQPSEIANTAIEHMGTLANYLGQDKLNTKQANWPQIGRSVWDMTVDVIDKLENKSTAIKSPTGTNINNANWMPYSASHDQPAVQQPSIWNQFIFSPKRGEFKFFGVQSTPSLRNYWTRA